MVSKRMQAICERHQGKTIQVGHLRSHLSSNVTVAKLSAVHIYLVKLTGGIGQLMPYFDKSGCQAVQDLERSRKCRKSKSAAAEARPQQQRFAMLGLLAFKGR
jgi:hypothetical protein